MANAHYTQGTWFSSELQRMTVRVHECNAAVYDGVDKPWKMVKIDGEWPSPENERQRVAVTMVKYVENELSGEQSRDNSL